MDKSLEKYLKEIGSNLVPTDSNQVPFPYTQVEYDNRSSQIMLSSEERLFSIDLWCDGIRYGGWWIDDLKKISILINDFIEKKFTINDMKRKYKWFKSESGELHEKDPKYTVKKQWKEIFKYTKNEPKNSQLKNLILCVKVAYKIKNLRILFPFTSMDSLCFSLTTGYPFKEVGPIIRTLPHDKYCLKIDDKEFGNNLSIKQVYNLLLENNKYYGCAIHGTDKDLI